PRLFGAMLLLIACVATSPAQARRAMTINDLITAVRVGDLQLSPDGKRVLYTRTMTAADTGKRNSDIWVVPADGSTPPRAFITGEKSESTARFTPDGKRIVFISNRDGTPQVYVSDAEGRNPKAITKISGGVQ